MTVQTVSRPHLGLAMIVDCGWMSRPSTSTACVETAESTCVTVR
jgi:hypothetical protein